MKSSLNTLQSKRHNSAKFSELYEMGKKLGEGNFATVYEVTSKKDQVSGSAGVRRGAVGRRRTFSLFSLASAAAPRGRAVFCVSCVGLTAAWGSAEKVRGQAD